MVILMVIGHGLKIFDKVLQTAIYCKIEAIVHFQVALQAEQVLEGGAGGHHPCHL